MNLFKDTIEKYTESEFLAFLEAMMANPDNLKGRDFGKRVEKFVEHFKKVTEHPEGSDVIFYPKEGQEDSPKGILKEVKQWRAANGKPGFKREDD